MIAASSFFFSRSFIEEDKGSIASTLGYGFFESILFTTIRTNFGRMGTGVKSRFKRDPDPPLGSKEVNSFL